MGDYIVKQGYEIRLTPMAFQHLSELQASLRRRVRDEMVAQLSWEPVALSRRKKPLNPSADIPWSHEPPVWALRVGDVRIFYDVDEPRRIVHVRAIRTKGRKQMKEIL